MKACKKCGKEFAPAMRTHLYCSRSCQIRRPDKHLPERARKVAGTKREVRDCLNCGVPLVGRRSDALRCRPCHTDHKLAENVSRQAARRARTAKAVLTVTPKIKKVQPPQRKSVHPKKEPKPDMSKPNLDGDWFPGWKGCYPARYTERDIAMIEQGRELLIADDTNRQVDRDGKAYRHSNFGRIKAAYPEDVAS